MMVLLQPCRADPVIQQHSPAPVSSRYGPLDAPLAAQAMNASELMYFFGAPLAHVVDYEDHLRANRCERTIREMTRGRRAPGFPAPLVPPAASSGSADAGGHP
jgi:hypothetical protein